MGNTQHGIADLVYLRAWTAADVAEVAAGLRWRRTVMAVDRQHFGELVTGRCPEALRVFEHLDTDFDGKVDTFEVLVTFILWSKSSWSEKVDLLFRVFDFNRKGSLRFPELAFMVATTAKAMGKFVHLESALDDIGAQKTAAADAFPDRQQGFLAFEGFRDWFEADELFAKRLRALVEENTAEETAAEAVEAPIRKHMRVDEYRAQELVQELERMQTKIAQVDDERENESVERSEQDKQQFEVLRARFAELLTKLTCARDTLQRELLELNASLSREGGAVALSAPTTQLQHEQMLAEVAVLERRCMEDVQEASQLLQRLVDLTYGSAASRAPLELPELLPELSAPLPTISKKTEEDARQMRLLDREAKRQRGIIKPQSSVAPPVASKVVTATWLSGEPEVVTRASDASSANVAASGRTADSSRQASAGKTSSVAAASPGGAATPEASMPIVVAFAAFDPPASNETQMLTLKVGDEIIATGRDEGGWWYGRKTADGKEGWFPPSYVQAKEDGPM